MHENFEKPLTPPQAAEHLEVCVRTLLNLRRKCGLPFFRVGAQIRYDRMALNAWKQKQLAQSEAGI